MSVHKNSIDDHFSSTSKRDYLVPSGLILLSFVPIVAGLARLFEVVKGGDITAENARFFDAPIPISIHIICSVLFCILGAFQFNARFRSRHRVWHLLAGRLVIFCGLAAAISGCWMAHFYPLTPHSQHRLLYVFRMLIGGFMAASILLSLMAIRRKSIAQHRAWIMRGYAIGQGAGTQTLVLLPVMLLGEPDTLINAFLMIASWAFNLLVVEWLIRR